MAILTAKLAAGDDGIHLFLSRDVDFGRYSFQRYKRGADGLMIPAPQNTPEKRFSAKPTVAMAAFLLISFAAPMAHAYTPEGDLMKIKGYSPELVETTNVQRSRQEWRTPSVPKRSPFQQLLHNIWSGNWSDDLDPPGFSVIRDH